MNMNAPKTQQRNQDNRLQLDSMEDAQTLIQQFETCNDNREDPPDAVKVLELLATKASDLLEQSVAFNWSEYHRKQLLRMRAAYQYSRIMLDFDHLSRPASEEFLAERQRIETIIDFIDTLITHK